MVSFDIFFKTSNILNFTAIPFKADIQSFRLSDADTNRSTIYRFASSSCVSSSGASSFTPYFRSSAFARSRSQTWGFFAKRPVQIRADHIFVKHALCLVLFIVAVSVQYLPKRFVAIDIRPSAMVFKSDDRNFKSIILDHDIRDQARISPAPCKDPRAKVPRSVRHPYRSNDRAAGSRRTLRSHFRHPPRNPESSFSSRAASRRPASAPGSEAAAEQHDIKRGKNPPDRQVQIPVPPPRSLRHSHLFFMHWMLPRSPYRFSRSGYKCPIFSFMLIPPEFFVLPRCAILLQKSSDRSWLIPLRKHFPCTLALSHLCQYRSC